MFGPLSPQQELPELNPGNIRQAKAGRRGDPLSLRRDRRGSWPARAGTGGLDQSRPLRRQTYQITTGDTGASRYSSPSSEDEDERKANSRGVAPLTGLTGGRGATGGVRGGGAPSRRNTSVTSHVRLLRSASRVSAQVTAATPRLSCSLPPCVVHS
jgi:hypothetical protein